MLDQSIVIVTSTVKSGRGGRTKAVLNRANILVNHYQKVLIITMDYQRKFKEDIQTLYKRKELDKRVEVINFYENLANKSKRLWPFNLNIKGRLKIKKKMERKKIKRVSGYKYEYYSKGSHIKDERYDKQNRLCYVDYYDSSNLKYKRSEYNEHQKLVKIKHFNNNATIYESYINTQGKEFLKIEFNNGKESRVIYRNQGLESFEKLWELKSIWLEQLLKNMEQPIVFCENRRLDKIFMSIHLGEIKKIAVIHTNHLAKSYDNIKNIRKIYRRLFENHNSYDKILVLTYEQKEDINKIYKLGNKVVVVPHMFNTYKDQPDNNKEGDKSSHVAVTLARYHKVKRLHEAIYAFKLVVDRVPDAIYNIYGKGPERKELAKLIKKLKLENNVFLKGYTNNPSLAYRQAACSILTSEYEGFGLVIIESMAEGTPVVSYDINYGPKEIIKDEENGFLVESGNYKVLAEKIISLMADSKLQQRLSRNALSVQDVYSKKNYEENLIKLINSL